MDRDAAWVADPGQSGGRRLYVVIDSKFEMYDFCEFFHFPPVHFRAAVFYFSKTFLHYARLSCLHFLALDHDDDDNDDDNVDTVY